MKRFFLKFLLLVLLVGLVSACSNTENQADNINLNPDKKKLAGEKLYIPVIAKGQEHQFWQAVRKGAEQAAGEYGVEITFEGPATETKEDVDNQVGMLKKALDKNPAAICFAALDTQAALPYIEDAAQRGIPIIAFDSGVDSDLVLTLASTDDYIASAYAAGKMAEMINGEGEIAVVAHSEISVQRRDGFVHAIDEKYPNIKIVDIVYADGEAGKSAKAVKEVIARHPNLVGLFGTNEGGAIGCVNAISELDETKDIKVIGFDSGISQIKAIKNGTEAGAISQNPIGIGYRAVEAAVMAAKGEKVDKIIDTGFYWYDKTNIDDPAVSAVLYE